MVHRLDWNRFIQRSKAILASAAAHSWQRHFSGGARQAWVLTFGQASLLSQVTQSGSVPTGAVIERDAAATGESMSFAEGTQISASAGGIVTEWLAGQRCLILVCNGHLDFSQGVCRSPTANGSVPDGACWPVA